MQHHYGKSAMFIFALVTIFDTGSPLLVSIGGKGKSGSKLQFQTVVPCDTDEDCTSVQNTTCLDIGFGSKSCRCGDNELPNLGNCWLLNKDLSNTCSHAQDCYMRGNSPENVDCVESVCHCKMGYYANEDTTSCQEIEYPASTTSLEILNLCLLVFTSCLAVLTLYKLIKMIRFTTKFAPDTKYVC